MNPARLLLVTLFSGSLALSSAARAADIDIYAGLGGSAGNPNVLIVFDNAANFSSSASASVSTCQVKDPTTGNMVNNSLAGTVGGIEQCAFYSVLGALPTNSDGSARINIGFMVYNSNNITDYQGKNCGGSNGGCLVYPLTGMAGSTRTNLLNWITTWKTSNSGTGTYWIKASGEATAAAMQEAWAYYSGNTGLSGRSYSGIQPTAGCEKNFVIFIGNSYDTAGSPGDGGSANPAAALTTANGGTAPAVIYNTLNTSCGSFSFPTGNNHVTGGFYGDEWSQFMDTTNVYNNSGTPIQGTNIVTYTVGVLGPSCQASYAALLTSMANNGGGKYFPTTNYSDLVLAILKILNEVQAVNSVFSAATLPVSVNTQGTYLNQIFMGMFRPDANGYPRWVGNLKQYQFQLDQSTVPPSLYLADAMGNRAISSAGTGFISSNAMSYWSCTYASRASTLGANLSLTSAQITAITCPSAATTSGGPDPTVGFFADYASYVTGSAGGAFDLQDGELVEKGGVSQQLRLANLYASYPTSTSTTDSPRNVYIYCPSGTGCNSDLTAASNSFSVSNSALGCSTCGSVFGTGISVNISSIVRNGNVATATTIGVHGLVAGNQVTITGATPNDYNGLVTVLTTPAPTANTFSYTVMQNPPTPAAGSYVAGLPGASGTAISSISRPAVGSGNTATVTVSAPGSNFSGGNQVQISGATPADYNILATVLSSPAPSTNTFYFSIPVYPVASQSTQGGTTATLTGSYSVTLANTATLTVNNSITGSGNNQVVTQNITCSGSTVSVTTSTQNSLRTGETVQISGDTQNGSTYNGTYTNITVLSTTQFQAGLLTSHCPGNTPNNLTVTPGPGRQSITSLTRTEGTVGSGTATARIGTSGLFANGDKVNITATGLPANGSETGYVLSNVTISCTPVSSTDAQCAGSTFTYGITTTPAQQSATTGMTATLSGGVQTISSLNLSGNTVTAVLASGATGFNNGASVNITAAAGTVAPANETAYTGLWTITCSGASPCTTFTYGPIAVTPVSPATLANATASAPGITPDPVSLINWIRGQDNMGDETSLCPGAVSGSSTNAITGANYVNCPSTVVTVRPSVHGDTLHSRPIAVNYGGTTGVVVYYGTNDGMFHAANGNQTTTIGSTPPGGELWGLVKIEDLGKYYRQRQNTPYLLTPSTPAGLSAVLKDYFVDGPAGLYQVIDANGNTTKAIIYLCKRRGGRSITALDVTNPQKPVYLWKVSNATTQINAAGQTWSLNELGQTWSLPKVAQLSGYPNPVLIFAAGYDDGNEDNDPPTPDIMGRGIYVLDAVTGSLVWSATPGAPTVTCTTTQCQKQVTNMTYAMPADITLMDGDNDGVVERLYAVDVGGNVWRVDLEPPAGSTPDKWQVTQFAALGCNNGACASGTAGRKFFYPAEVIGHTSNNNYDAVIVGSGDREKPLYGDQYGNSCTNCEYAVVNRLYMLKDLATGNDGSADQTITELSATSTANLDDCTGTSANPNTCSTATTGASQPLSYNLLTTTQQHMGYYITLCMVNTSSTTFTQTTCPTGEKVENAPLATAGYVYFGTNQPTPKSTPVTSCTTNLGIARGYQVAPFSANYGGVVYAGGGLPPSPVSGIVTIGSGANAVNVPFLIGGANPGCTTSDCLSPVSAMRPQISVSTVRHRTYWYIEGK